MNFSPNSVELKGARLFCKALYVRLFEKGLITMLYSIVMAHAGIACLTYLRIYIASSLV